MSWVEIPVGDIVVENDFYLLLHTYSDNDSGIVIGYTGNKNDNHTAVANANRILPWTLPTNLKTTNWIIRMKYSSSDAPLSLPIPPDITTYKEAVAVLNTPEELSQWMVENMSAGDIYGSGYTPVWPEDMFEKRSGICADLSVFAFDILKKTDSLPSFWPSKFL